MNSSLSGSRKSPDFYRNYASLFLDYFPGVSEQQVNVLNRAGLNCYRAAVQLDGLIDEGDPGSIFALLRGYGQSIRELTGLFGQEHAFWEWWELRQKEFADASQLERLLHSKAAVTFEEFEKLADGKSALAKLAIDALYLLSPGAESPDAHAVLLESHAYFSSALQLYDDAVDVREDWGSGRFNWVIYTYRDYWNRYGAESGPDGLLKAFYAGGAAVEVFNRVIALFDLAMKHAPGKGRWTECISRVSQEIRGYITQIQGYISIARSQARIFRVQPHFVPWPEFKGFTRVVNRGLKFLEDDYRRGWPGLRHTMYFSVKEGLEYGAGLHSSDLFFRALANCFLERLRYVQPEFNQYLDLELGYFLRQRREHAMWGWSYFPSLRTLSCDLDDQAQVMRYFLRMERRDLLEPFCSRIIDSQLSDGLDARGIPLTWVTAESISTVYTGIQRRLNARLWGEGPHVEVVANFADCLTEYRPHAHRRMKAVWGQYLKEEQLPSGGWHSRWYAGLPYGAYRIATYLYRVGSGTENSVDRWHSYALVNQNEDGGYGLYPGWPSDSLSTALVALSLRETGMGGSPAHRKALQFLVERQTGDGGWESVPFVAPKPNQFFKSRTITAVFALDALCDPSVLE